MLFRRMKYFSAVVECGSFTAAAKSCGVSQSAISQQIAALESSMGVTLIERSGRGFRLTTAGDYFYRNGKQVLRSAEELYTRTAEL